jgi:Glycosyl transferase family 2
MSPGDLAVIIPAKNEADRVAATISAATKIAGVDIVVVVDDGSTDETAALASAAGAHVVRHARNRGKAAAMETGAEAVALIESGAAGPVVSGAGPRLLLFLDADLADSAAEAGPLAEPVRAGTADMTIAVFTDQVRKGGFGFVTGTAGAGIERATGWRPAQPLNGQRCLTRAAFTAALPLAPGWGTETGMTIDLLRKGLRVTEVEVPLSHRATGNDWRSQVHRLHQLVDVGKALAARDPAVRRLRDQLTRAPVRPAGS